MRKKITLESLRKEMEAYREERHALIDRMVDEKQEYEDLPQIEADNLKAKLKAEDWERRP